MIEKVGLSYNIKFKNNTSQKTVNNTTPPQVKPDNNPDFNHYYMPVNFTGKNRKQRVAASLEDLEYCYTNSASKLVDEATKIAKQDNNLEVNHFHIWKVVLNQLDKYIDDLNNGTKQDMDANDNTIQAIIEDETTYGLFEDKEIRNNLQKIIKEDSKKLDMIISQLPKDKNVQNPKLSDELVRDIWVIKDKKDRVYDTDIFEATFLSENETIKGFVDNFINKVNAITMLEKMPVNKRPYISEYDKKAENVWKNLALGTNMFVTYDHKKVNPDLFITSLYKTQPQNTEITEFNSKIKEQYLLKKVNEISKDKDKNHIIIMFPAYMLINSASPEEETLGTYNYTLEFQKLMSNVPPNTKFIMVENKDNYFVNMQNQDVQKMYENFGEVSVPVLSTEQFVKAFKEEPLLMDDIKKPFTKKAIEKTIENAAQLDGVFPEKAQKLMKKMASYYIDKKEITEKDVNNYLKEAKELFRKTDDNSSVNVVFDTGKRLKDIIGKNSTKKEAAAIVKQIKSNRMGTKGTIIYSQDSTPGSGRRFIAKAIAGEAKVPYIEMNAMDFGTKEVDIFGGTMLSPEASIKKMFSFVNTQAESNSNKCAVLFIENFEYFSIGELISEYQQKAMAQLLREMDNAERKGLNILVVGSVSDPQMMGAAAMKSFKFVDSIEVSSPAYNAQERAEIIKNTVKENKIKIAGNTSQEKEDLINAIAKTTKGFPFIYMKNIVKKAQSVALERGHKEITKGDFTEAYLQITTGRPSTNIIQEHEKRIVTSHECGHALNLEVMNDIAKTYGKPWHKTGKVNFITLDPRGMFGGAMFSRDDFNKQESFENIFADIVCSYGGHSCEKYFYGMDGSWGISADLENATEIANIMIQIMGQGARFGKQSLWDSGAISNNLRNIIEQDRKVILDNALIVSDLITEVYEDFNKEFTDKYSDLVGTGECLVDGDVFREELSSWKSRQPLEKQEEIKIMEEMILDIIAKTKQGKSYKNDSLTKI